MLDILVTFVGANLTLADANGESAGEFSKVLGNLGIHWQQLISQLVIFIVLVWILKKFAYQPVLKVLDERKKRIEESMANVEKIKNDLAATEQNCQAIMAKANATANALIAKTKSDAESLNAKKIQETVRQVETMLKKAEESAAQERERLLDELRQEMGRLVVLTTSKVIGRSLTVEDQARLQKEALADLKN
jgi:F-type H+-transporting ATPase subunit b